MMNRIQEILTSLALIILLVLLWNPFSMWMPNKVVMLVVSGIALVFALFAIFIWKESAFDEREVLHKSFAGRIAYLAGSSVLVLGIIVQSLQHNLDLWLVFVLGIMVFSKMSGLLYIEKKL